MRLLVRVQPDDDAPGPVCPRLLRWANVALAVSLRDPKPVLRHLSLAPEVVGGRLVVGRERAAGHKPDRLPQDFVVARFPSRVFVLGIDLDATAWHETPGLPDFAAELARELQCDLARASAVRVANVGVAKRPILMSAADFALDHPDR